MPEHNADKKKTNAKKKAEHKKQNDSLTTNDREYMEYMYGDTVNIPLTENSKWLPKQKDIKNAVVKPPKTYLIFVGEDNNNAFIYPARHLEQRIKGGDFFFNVVQDDLKLIMFHDVDDMNNAMKQYKNIYAIFIYAHSLLPGHEGFTASLRNEGAKYNIGMNERVANSIPVTKLYSSNMMSDGFIHLYSCHAAYSDKNGEDIAHSMARHFGVRVFANSTGVSLCPSIYKQASQKTKVCTDNIRWVFGGDNFGYFRWIEAECRWKWQ